MEKPSISENPTPEDVEQALIEIDMATRNKELEALSQNKNQLGKRSDDEVIEGYEEEHGRRSFVHLEPNTENIEDTNEERDTEEVSGQWYFHMIPEKERNSEEILELFGQAANSERVRQIKDFRFTEPADNIPDTLKNALEDLNELSLASSISFSKK